MQDNIRKLTFYTDGAYSSATEMGGWACLCIEEGKIIEEESGYEPYTTNNRMELHAVLYALEQIDSIPSRRLKVSINTDSAYIANCINDEWFSNWMRNGWKTSDKQDVKNQDLWSRIVVLYLKNKSRLVELRFVKVKGHSTNEYNKRADELAVVARKRLEVV